MSSIITNLDTPYREALAGLCCQKGIGPSSLSVFPLGNSDSTIGTVVHRRVEYYALFHNYQGRNITPLCMG